MILSFLCFPRVSFHTVFPTSTAITFLSLKYSSLLSPTILTSPHFEVVSLQRNHSIKKTSEQEKDYALLNVKRSNYFS
jgi:hypothetical protein